MSTSGAASSSTSSTRSHIMNGLATCTLISESMQRDLGRVVLHRSQWRCLLSTYSAEIQALIDLNGSNRIDLNERPVLVLQQALQEGRACMQAYIPVSSSGNYNSWLVDKALKHAMSSDVVDLHLHNFLWASSVVRQQVRSILLYSHQLEDLVKQLEDLVKQVLNLNKIWSEVDADEDLRIAKSFLIKLKGKCTGATCQQVVDFILQKLFHIQESPHNHVTPGPLPSYMCILHSNQCLHRNTLRSNNNGTPEVSEVMWLGGQFVLKSFKQKYLDEEKFKREAAIQARVWHPHVVPLVCCTNEPPGLLMERMQEDLDALIERSSESSGKDSPFPELFMDLDLMLQIVKGMEYLHSDTLCIIHRDLKPANIFVNSGAGGDSNDDTVISPQVHLKIGDFGVSKAKHECSEYSTRDQGTTLYMAPEVYEGADEPKYSNKADVYSFGMVCYAILTGRRPFFCGPLNGDIRRRVKGGERPGLPPHCPPALSSFIEMCWHANPTERPTFIQICRILRYYKACILLQGEPQHWISGSFSLRQCAERDTLMDRCLAGRILEPKALGIPLEMYFYSGLPPISKATFPEFFNTSLVISH